MVSGGEALAHSAVEQVPDGALVVAADSGVDRAAEVGLGVDVAVGDFDSVDPVVLDEAVRSGTHVVRHPAAKDQSDLELALDLAMSHRPGRIIVLGGHGGRLDHFFANALLLASPAYAGSEVVAYMGTARIAVVRTTATIGGRPGDLVTLLPVHGPAQGVRTRGLLYPLEREDLDPGTTRGLSNELNDAEAAVSLERGTLLVIQPAEVGAHLHASIPFHAEEA